jgi:hypothetical protein
MTDTFVYSITFLLIVGFFGYRNGKFNNKYLEDKQYSTPLYITTIATSTIGALLVRSGFFWIGLLFCIVAAWCVGVIAAVMNRGEKPKQEPRPEPEPEPEIDSTLSLEERIKEMKRRNRN